jgi:transposase
MQILLPISPVGTEMISANLGVGRKDGIVTYLHSGMPIYSHLENDYRSFRFITSKFILQGLCRKIDISACFHVSYDSVKRYIRRLEERGDRGFFTVDNRNGGSRYKLLPEVIKRMQRYLDEGMSNSEIARKEGVTEGTVRYAIKNGVLKKSLLKNISLYHKAATGPNGA